MDIQSIFNPSAFYVVTGVMTVLAVIVFIALQRIDAPYGMMYSAKWGPSVGNKTGWVVMEAPAFLCMALIWAVSPRRVEAAPAVMASLFLLHYFQRSFIFPFMMRGKSRMPWLIALMGLTFNVINAYMIGGWLFFVSPPELYSASWLLSPLFMLGTVIFFAGMAINIHSDHIIRHLRKPGDTRHYIPRGGLYSFVTGANYFGEVTEWTGFAILTWSWPGVVFVLWTFANLAPRARTLHRRYISEFGEEYSSLRRKYIIPFLY